MKRWMFVMLLWTLGLSAEEPMPQWMTSRAARGRIEVYALDAVQLQQLSFWSGRGLKQLEQDWQTVVPFQLGQPMKLIIEDRATEVRLTQEWRQGVLVQILRLPWSAVQKTPEKLAETFTRAMAFRVGLASMPPERRNLEWQVPDWLVHGSAQALLKGRSGEIFEKWVREYAQGAPPYPEQLSRMADAGDSEENDAAAALLCRWLFQQKLPNLWAGISLAELRTPEGWLGMLPGIGNLRELHQHWDLWWQEERNHLLADYAVNMDDEARARLAVEQVFTPAFYGLYLEGKDRFQPLSFAGLKDYLDDPRFGLAMQEWILRLQRLRFRQSDEFNKQVENLQQAGRLAIQASMKKGRKRDKLWAAAVDALSLTTHKQ